MRKAAAALLVLAAACTSTRPRPAPTSLPPLDPAAALLTAADLGAGWTAEGGPSDPGFTACPGRTVEAEVAAVAAFSGDEAVDGSYVEQQVFRVDDLVHFRERVRQAVGACATYRLDERTECTAGYAEEVGVPVVRYRCGDSPVHEAVVVLVSGRGLVSAVTYAVGEGLVGADQHTRMIDLARRRLGQ